MMKFRLGREIALLSLPIAIIGGLAWLQSGRGRALLPKWLTSNPFDPGPMRLEYSPFKTIELTPLEAAEGFDWKAQTTVRERGRWDVPKGFRDDGTPFGMTASFRMVYRRGRVWAKAPNSQNGKSLISWGTSKSTDIRVNLKTVPRDAEEVRLRGRFMQIHMYRGVAPRGWKSPKNMKNYPLNHILSVDSPPFDVQIKGPGQAWPTFTGSRVSGLKFTSANQQWCLPDPVEDPKGDKLQVESEFLTANSKKFGFEPTRSRVTDANGNTVLGITPIGWKSGPRSFRSVKWIIDTRQLKKHKAPFVLRSWVYVDKDHWPLSVTLPLNLTRSAPDSMGISTYNSKPIQAIR